MLSSRVTLLAACLALFHPAVSGAIADPSDPDLQPGGRAILTYFQKLQSAPELRLVSGQFAGWSGVTTIAEMEKIHRATGQWPAMIGLDYCGWDGHGEALVAPAAPNRLALEYWRSGGLVNISWHAPNPANPKGGGLRDKGVNLQDLLTEGTDTHRRWLASLDTVAAGLRELQDAGVIVIWRPLHEMNGGWFWWGAKEPADFIAVWRHMHDYLTRTKKLHNLIWAYSPNHGQKSIAGYYPGDAFTDLVGLDAYTDHIDHERIQRWSEVIAPGKPAGFTEYGPHGASNPPGDYDYRRLLDGLTANFPQARHFLCWNDKWNPAENLHAREFYNDERVISRDRLPAGLAGGPPAPAVADDYAASIETWRTGRLGRLVKPDGWLALIGRHPLEVGTWTVGSAADNAIRLAAGPAHLGTITHAAGRKVSLVLTEGADAVIEGTSARSGELVVDGETPTQVRAGTVSFYVMDRSGKLFLRVRDSESARRKNFAGIEHYAVDPRWRIEAAWAPFETPRQIQLENIIGLTEPASVPGKAVFTIEGKACELLAVEEEPGARLFFIFTDPTAGSETYEACRFYYADRPKDGKIILDFNRAYNPPCAFTPFATCPLPPKENRLSVPIRAGEKKYRGSHE